MDTTAIEKALKQYEAQKRHSANYYNKKKQERIENGTYKGRGRPRKDKGEGVCEKVEIESSKGV